jgi:hypothetical protein
LKKIFHSRIGFSNDKLNGFHGCESQNTNKTQRGAAIGAWRSHFRWYSGNNVVKGGNGACAVLGGVVGGVGAPVTKRQTSKTN